MIKYLRKLINIYTIVKLIKLAKISAFILIILVRISFNWQVFCTLIPLIAFAFNAKSFGIAFLVFSFFLLVTFSRRIAKSFLDNVL